MTPKQRNSSIILVRKRMGYQHSQQEIAQGWGLESPGTVQHYLQILERGGMSAGSGTTTGFQACDGGKEIEEDATRAVGLLVLWSAG